MGLWIALHHHKHGVSSILVAAEDEARAEDKAVAWFKKHDDLTDEDLDMDDPGWDGERVEVGRATLPRGYRPPGPRRVKFRPPDHREIAATSRRGAAPGRRVGGP